MEGRSKKLMLILWIKTLKLLNSMFRYMTPGQ